MQNLSTSPLPARSLDDQLALLHARRERLDQIIQLLEEYAREQAKLQLTSRRVA